MCSLARQAHNKAVYILAVLSYAAHPPEIAAKSEYEKSFNNFSKAFNERPHMPLCKKENNKRNDLMLDSGVAKLRNK